MSLFSERNGYISPFIQKDSINRELQIKLWNIIYQLFRSNLSFDHSTGGHKFKVEIKKLAYECWSDFFCIELDKKPYADDRFSSEIKPMFFSLVWFKIYDFLEFICSHLNGSLKERFKKDCNLVLTKENSTYIFVGENIVDSITPEEITEIEKSLKTPYTEVNSHIKKSIEFLSDKLKPDYENSIKESISAVEALIKIYTNEPNKTLGALLQNPKLTMHASLREGLNKIYGFASDQSGVRHANKKTTISIKYPDALFISIFCSSLINYLILKQIE